MSPLLEGSAQPASAATSFLPFVPLSSSLVSGQSEARLGPVEQLKTQTIHSYSRDLSQGPSTRVCRRPATAEPCFSLPVRPLEPSTTDTQTLSGHSGGSSTWNPQAVRAKRPSDLEEDDGPHTSCNVTPASSSSGSCCSEQNVWFCVSEPVASK